MRAVPGACILIVLMAGCASGPQVGHDADVTVKPDNDYSASAGGCYFRSERNSVILLFDHPTPDARLPVTFLFLLEGKLADQAEARQCIAFHTGSPGNYTVAAVYEHDGCAWTGTSSGHFPSTGMSRVGEMKFQRSC